MEERKLMKTSNFGGEHSSSRESVKALIEGSATKDNLELFKAINNKVVEGLEGLTKDDIEERINTICDSKLETLIGVSNINYVNDFIRPFLISKYVNQNENHFKYSLKGLSHGMKDFKTIAEKLDKHTEKEN